MACVPTVPMSSVRPSGADFATASAPSEPPAPPRLSITITDLRASPSNCAKGLATISVGPPAGNGTIKRVCRPAVGCAAAVSVHVTRPSTAALIVRAIDLCMTCGPPDYVCLGSMSASPFQNDTTKSLKRKGSCQPFTFIRQASDGSRDGCAGAAVDLEIARAHDEPRERVDFKIVLQVVAEQLQPLLLCLVGELFALARTFKLELSPVLEMVNHLVDEHGQFSRRVAAPALGQVDRAGCVIIDRHDFTLAGLLGGAVRLLARAVLVAQRGDGRRRHEFDMRMLGCCR